MARVSRIVGKCGKTLPCTGKCGKRKTLAKFRIRVYKHSGAQYYNTECKICENNRAKAVYNKVKDDPEFIKKNRTRIKKYREDNIELEKERQKAKRQTPGYKKFVKKYYKKNKKKILEQQRITGRRWHEKEKKAVTDQYVIGKLVTQGYTKEQIELTPQLIEIKRGQILLARIKRKVKRKVVGKTKICTRCKKEKDLSQFYEAGKCVDGITPKYCSNCITCNSETGAIARKNKENERKKNFK